MRVVVAGLVIAACFAASFVVVAPSNFGGWDEWFYMALVSKGVLSVPYANRPLVFLMAQPVTWIGSGSIWSYFFLHAGYLTAAGFVAFLLVRRLASFGVALLAGIFAAIYAPTDFLRLDSVLMTGYAGFTLATMTTLLLLVEAMRRDSLPLLVLGAALGSVAARGFEGILPLLLAAPVLLPFLEDAGPRRRRLRMALLWELALVPIVTLALWPIVHPPETGSYQAALGFDPKPLAVVRRMATLFGYSYRPLIVPPLHDAAVPIILAAVLVFGLGLLIALRLPAPAQERAPSRPRLAALLGLGMLLSCAAWAPFALTKSTIGPARTQYLSSFGTGLSLAAACVLLASFVAPRVRDAALVLLGSWVVAVATSGTVDMQSQWSSASLWDAQRLVLSRLVARVPDTRENTLLLLLDGQEAFPANFTFRHAVEMLYEGRAVGLAWGSEPYLYPAHFEEAGVFYEPREAIREAWRVTPTHHRWSEIVTLRWTGREVVVLESWPAIGIAKSAPGYDPFSRITESTRPPVARRLLR